MEEDLYDEFGNYIGPALRDDESGGSEEDSKVMEESEISSHHREAPQPPTVNPPTQQIVLHQDKEYYEQNVFPEGVETLVQEEDTQPITQPLIESKKEKTFFAIEKILPQTNFDFNYLSGLLNKPARIRNIAIVGQLHHGKTALVDLLLRKVHEQPLEERYTDTRTDELLRKISMKTVCVQILGEASNGKSFALNIADTPGHCNYEDEVEVGLRLADGVVMVVDVVEGVMLGTQRILRRAVLLGLPIVILLNKIDRLVLELRLPPADAYHKIKHTLEQVNYILRSMGCEQLISPTAGNVVFASTELGGLFTLQSWALMHFQSSARAKQITQDEEDESHLYGLNFADPNKSNEKKYPKISQELVKQFASKLWGDLYYNPETRKFQSTGEQRSFVHFVLEPLYKVIGYSLGEDQSELRKTLSKLGVFLTKRDFKLDIKPLLQLVFYKWLGGLSPLVDAIVQHLPSPDESNKLNKLYFPTTPDSAEAARSIASCNPKGPLYVHIAKLVPKADCAGFDALGRVMSGTLHKDQTVSVLGEEYSLEEPQDMALKSVSGLYLSMARYRVAVSQVSAGSWVLIEGIDRSLTKTGTLISPIKVTEQGNVEGDAPQCYLEPLQRLQFQNKASMKVAVEPYNPSELPKLLEGLRKINKYYPAVETKVEQSGQHTLHGTGELYLDSILHDLRLVFADIEVKVSDPFVELRETALDTSAMKCKAKSKNGKNEVALICEPLDTGLASDIEQSRIKLYSSTGQKNELEVAKYLQKHYEWDELTSAGVWAFGPTAQGPNVLVDYTLPSETDGLALNSVQESIVQGFLWATREGPLCEEPLYNLKFKVMDVDLASVGLFRGGGQIIPTVRRACYSSLLMAQPRMMEPILRAQIQCPSDCISVINDVLIRRRGHINSQEPKPGTPLFTLQAQLPMIDSFGFETDVRTITGGQAFVLTVFDHWVRQQLTLQSMVPGDPLDPTIQLLPLEPSPPPHLAREFMLKTRRRKGLRDELSITKFFDAQEDIEEAQYIFEKDLAGGVRS